MTQYHVTLTQHGQPVGHQDVKPTNTFTDKADAIAKMKRMNKILSPGEKAHYGFRYKVLELA